MPEIEEDKEESIPFTSYSIVRFEVPRNDEPRMQIQEYGTWKLYEAKFCIHRNNETGELSWGVVRHFGDPDSQAWFPDSEVWPAEYFENEDDDNGNQS